jgi:hypothetical protein
MHLPGARLRRGPPRILAKPLLARQRRAASRRLTSEDTYRRKHA